MCWKDRLPGRWPALEREVADEWVQRHASETFTGRACTKCCSQKRKDFWCSTVLANLCYSFLGGLILLAIICLIIFLAVFVVPHFQSASYKKTTCTVSSIYDQEVIKCTCGKLCFSSTICLKINVKYMRDDGEAVEGMLHQTDEDVGDSCTFAPCGYNNLPNNREVAEDIAHEYPKSFDCLYDPSEGSTNVIREHAFNENGPLIHMMVWPPVVVLLMIGGCVFLNKTCGSKYCMTGKVPPMEVIIIAARLRRQGIFKLYPLPVEERRRLLRECAPEPTEVQPQNIQRA